MYVNLYNSIGKCVKHFCHLMKSGLSKKMTNNLACMK